MNLGESSTDGRSEFRAGDSVVILYDGLYNGLAGRFVGLRMDPNWADIDEGNGSVRPHPVQWLRRPEDLVDLTAVPAEGFSAT
jgi:hypothetical protein